MSPSKQNFSKDQGRLTLLFVHHIHKYNHAVVRTADHEISSLDLKLLDFNRFNSI